MILGRTKEDCLEAIFVLGKSRKIVRSVDIAKALEITKPSVSVMLRSLEEDGFVKKASAEDLYELSLTEKGLAFAQQLHERRCFFTELLLWAGVSRDVAEQEACELEHALSHESFNLVRSAVDRQRAARPA